MIPYGLLLGMTLLAQSPPEPAPAEDNHDSAMQFLGQLLRVAFDAYEEDRKTRAAAITVSVDTISWYAEIHILVNGESIGQLKENAEREFTFAANFDGKNRVEVYLINDTMFGKRVWGRSKTQWFRADPGAKLKLSISKKEDAPLEGNSLRLLVETIEAGRPPESFPDETLSGTLDPAREKVAIGKHFTLNVSREFKQLVGIAVPQDLYVNDRRVGEIWNGSRVRISVPIELAPDGTPNRHHTFKLSAWGMSHSESHAFVAGPGDEVKITTGVDVNLKFTSPNTVRELEVFPADHAKVCLDMGDSKDPRILVINRNRWRIDSENAFAIYDWAPINRFIRLEIGADSEGAPRQTAFVRPGETLALGLLGGNTPTEQFATNLVNRPKIYEVFALKAPDQERGVDSDRKRVVDSVAYIRQLRACVLYHTVDADDKTSIPLGWLDEDLNAINSEGVFPEVVELRDAYAHYFHQLDAKGGSAASIAGRGLLAAAFQLGVEALLTRSVPSGFDILSQAISTGAESGFEYYNLTSHVGAINAELKAVEDRAIATIREEWNYHPSLHDRPDLREILGSP